MPEARSTTSVCSNFLKLVVTISTRYEPGRRFVASKRPSASVSTRAGDARALVGDQDRAPWARRRPGGRSPCRGSCPGTTVPRRWRPRPAARGAPTERTGAGPAASRTRWSTGTFACSSSSASRRSPGDCPAAGPGDCPPRGPWPPNRKQTTADVTFYNFLLPLSTSFSWLHGLWAACALSVPCGGCDCSDDPTPVRLQPRCSPCSPACRRAGGRGRRLPAPAAGARPNVLLVTIDTLRADRVGCYGYAGASTPVLDALAARGVRFATAVAHVPAHRALPRLDPHRAHAARPRLPRERRLRAARRRRARAPRTSAQAGYRTAAFVSAFPLDRRFGFDRGFDDLRRPPAEGQRPAPHAVRRALRRRDHRRRPALARGARCRAPARSSSGSTTTTRTRRTSRPGTSPRASAPRPTTARSRSSTSSSAGCCARSRSGARSRARSSSRCPTTARASASTARARTASSSTTRRCASRFIVAGPGVAARPRRADGRARDRRAADAPRLAGLARRPEIEGRSLRPALEGREMSDAPAYAETLYPQREFGWAPLFAWRTATPQDDRGAEARALRPREATPARRTNRAARETARLARAAARSCRRRSRARPTAAAAAAVDPEAAERLRALGYVAGRRRREARGGRRRCATRRTAQRLMPGAQPRHVGRAHRPRRGDPRPRRPCSPRTPGLLDGPPLAGGRLHRRAPVRARDRRAAAAREGRGPLSAEDAIVLGDNLRFAGPPRRGDAPCSRRSRARTRASPSPGSRSPRCTSRRSELAEAAAAYEHVLADRARPRRGAARASATSRSLAQRRRRGRDAATRRILEVEPRDAGALTKLGVVRMRTRAAGRGDRPLPPGDRARAEERRGAALPRGRARLDRPPRRGAALLRAGARGRAAQPDGAQRPRPHADGARRPAGRRARRSASRCASTRSSRTSRARSPSCARLAGLDEPTARRGLDHERLARLGRAAGREVGDDDDRLVAAGRRAVERDAEARARACRRAAGWSGVSGMATRNRPSLRRIEKPAVTFGLPVAASVAAPYTSKRQCSVPDGGELPPRRRLGRGRRARRRLAPAGRSARALETRSPSSGRHLELVEQAADRAAVAVARHDPRLVAPGRERQLAGDREARRARSGRASPGAGSSRTAGRSA